MDVSELHERIADRLAGAEVEASTEDLTHTVLTALAERLTPDEAAELGAELPEPLGDLLAEAHGDGNLEREEFIEELASRLDIDDDAAERGAIAVLVSLRELLEPVVAIEQVLAGLPPDLAQLMHAP